MKRTFAAVFVLIVATTVSAEERLRYAVAMKTPVLRHSAPQFAGIDMGERDYEPMVFLQAYAADLTAAEAAALRKQPGVRYVEAAMTYRAFGLEKYPANADSLRNLDGQTTPYGIDLVHARDTWNVVRGAGINVAVVDTGIDYNHPDLRDRYAGGFNAITKTDDPLDDEGHGSHVSGTIAASDNSVGVVGVAPQARIWAVKVLDSSGEGTTPNIAAGINWVLDQKKTLGGDWIINLSLGDTHLSMIMQDACQKAADAGVLIVAASGNDSTGTLPEPVSYPAAFPTVVAVGAVDSASRVADFSNQGPELALVAPGVNVLSTFPLGAGELSFVKSGTNSFEAIHVVGSPKGTITAPYVFCAQGHAGEFPASVSGKIALIQRGDITFNEKAKNAKLAGAIAVVIFNNERPYSGFTFIGADPTDATFAWPLAVGIDTADGEAIKADPDATITISYVSDDYGINSGTSMASPHVAGVAALIWSAAPGATASQVRLALTSTARDLGAAGVDSVYGSGLVSALEAGKMLAPERFGSPTVPPPNQPPSGRRILRR